METSKYTCDECKRRKIRCSKTLPKCKCCADESRECVYTRSGIIRRKRKARLRGEQATRPSSPSTIGNGQHSPHVDDISHNDLPAITPDVQRTLAETRTILESVVSNKTSDQYPFWQDPQFLVRAEAMRRHYSLLFTFEKEAMEWAQLAYEFIRRREPLLNAQPMEKLIRMATHPEDFEDRAHLVIFYGVILSESICKPGFSEETLNKLRWNFWHCINDMRLMTEPKLINIQALVVCICRIHDFQTPAVCWMLAATACRMYLFLMTEEHSWSPEMRRSMRSAFWVLDDIDKTLVLIFGRPPAMPEFLYRSREMPELRELLDYHPHTSERTGTYGAHFLRQMFELSRIESDIAKSLSDPRSKLSKTVLRHTIDAWAERTAKALEAALLAEQDLLQPHELAIAQEGLIMTSFRHLYLSILLTRSSDPNGECIALSRRCLEVFSGLTPLTSRCYNGTMWQAIFQPFTAFFCLRDHVRHPDTSPAERELSLKAMGYHIAFLEKAKSHYPLATRLLAAAEGYMAAAQTVDETLTPRDRATCDSGYGPSNALSDVDPDTIDPENLMGSMSMFPHRMADLSSWAIDAQSGSLAWSYGARGDGRTYQ